MTQNPYGPTPGQPYGQASQPGQQYGQAPAGGQQYGYGAPYGQADPYGAPQGYAPLQATPYGAAPVKKKSAVLGLVGLGLVVVCGIVLSMFMWKMGSLAGPYVTSGTITTEQQTQLGTEVITQMGSLWPALGSLSSIVGFVGWIIGIVATATNRGRVFGVFAIILGVLAPFIAFGAMTAALAPFVQ